MKLYRVMGALAAGALALSTTVAQAETIRAGASLPNVTAANSGLLSQPAAKRASAKASDESNLLGTPLFLALLGAVAVTGGTIIIVNNNGNGNSKG